VTKGTSVCGSSRGLGRDGTRTRGGNPYQRRSLVGVHRERLFAQHMPARPQDGGSPSRSAAACDFSPVEPTMPAMFMPARRSLSTCTGPMNPVPTTAAVNCGDGTASRSLSPRVWRVAWVMRHYGNKREKVGCHFLNDHSSFVGIPSWRDESRDSIGTLPWVPLFRRAR
jgi:hypothetical protein